jgi:hypothetical protein
VITERVGLPPTPAAVASYFTRRRSAIAEFTPEDLASNERLWRAVCGLPELLAAAPTAPANTMPTGAAQSPAGEQVEGCGYPNTPPITPQIPDCAEAIEATGKSRSSPRRAYHRRAEPRGSGRWAQKRRPGQRRQRRGGRPASDALGTWLQ